MSEGGRQSGRRLAATKKTKTKKSQETAVLFMTDLHFGKETNSFTAEVLEARLHDFAEKVVGVKGLIGSGYDFDKLVVCLLGDVVDGTGIYPTQAHHQGESSVLEQMRRFEDILWSALTTMASGFPEVQVEAIPGNHGRVSKFAHEADNWDLVAYQGLRQRAKANPASGITVKYGGKEGLWIRNVKVRDHRFLLYHGHTIRSFANIPLYGIMNRVGRWATTREYGGFDAFACGHFHTCSYHQLNRIEIFLNGTAVTGDDWALEGLGYQSSNSWWFCGSSDNHTTTFKFPLEV